MKIENKKAALLLASGETVDRVKLKSLKCIILELDLIIYNSQKVKRQLKKAIRNQGDQ